jgi:hypothetical protein
LNRWKNYFSQLLNVHRVSDVRQIETHTAHTLVPDPSSLDVEISIEKFERYKSLGNDQIRSVLIQTGGERLHFEVHELVNSKLTLRIIM